MKTWVNIFFLTLLLPHLAQAEVKVIVPGQQTGTILYSSEEKKELTPVRVGQWKDFCDKLAKNLTQSANPPGFLSSASCQALGVAPPIAKADSPFWQIQIIERKRFFDVQTSILTAKEGYQKLRTHSFKIEADLLENLKSDEVALAIARLVVESIPTGWVYTHDASKDNFTFVSDKGVPSLPPDLLVYELSYDTATKKWMPKVRARLKRTKEENKLKERTETFKVAQVYLPLVDKKMYWVQSTQGLNKRQAEFEKVLGRNMQGLSLLSFLDKLILGSLESNYAGFRYGKSFLAGSSIVTETDMLSILGEMRGGLFSGLRIYYDLTPEKTKGSGDEAEYFRMSRLSLGWAFDYELPSFMNFLVSKVEVQPKFGLLDLKSHFTVLDDAGERQSLAFDAKNIYDLAIELGIEKESYWFRSRLWYSFSAAAFGLENKGNVSVFSNKAGIDAYFDFINYGTWDINILAFTSVERLSLSKATTKLADDADLGISDISFNLFFVGGGFTVSW